MNDFVRFNRTSINIGGVRLDTRGTRNNPQRNAQFGGVDSVLGEESREELNGRGENRFTRNEVQRLVQTRDNYPGKVEFELQPNGDYIIRNGSRFTPPLTLDPDALEYARQSNMFDFTSAQPGVQPSVGPAAPGAQPAKAPTAITPEITAQREALSNISLLMDDVRTAAPAERAAAADRAIAAVMDLVGNDDRVTIQAGYRFELGNGKTVSIQPGTMGSNPLGSSIAQQLGLNGEQLEATRDAADRWRAAHPEFSPPAPSVATPIVAPETKAAPAAAVPENLAGYMAMSAPDLVKLSEQRTVDAFKKDGIELPITMDGARTTEERNAVRQANTKLIETQATADGIKGLNADGVLSPEERTALSQTAKGRATLVMYDLPPVADNDRAGLIERLALTDRIMALPPGTQLDEVSAKALIEANQKAVEAALAGKAAPGVAAAPAAAVDTALVTKAEGPAATRYNSATMPDGLGQNQVKGVQQLLLDAGLNIGSKIGNVPDEKWGKQSQAAFEKICRDAGIDPKAVNFADLNDPETNAFMKAAAERGKERRGQRADFDRSMTGIIADVQKDETVREATAQLEKAREQVTEIQTSVRDGLKAAASAAPAKGPVDLLEGIEGFERPAAVAGISAAARDAVAGLRSDNGLAAPMTVRDETGPVTGADAKGPTSSPTKIVAASLDSALGVG